MGTERLVDVGGGVTLCWQDFGDRADRPLLLISGLGLQHVAWDDELCELLASNRFHVVRFDNRDVGRSTRWESPPPSAVQLALRRFPAGQYDLGDLAEDAAGLVRALELAPAHVLGVSMGGMIGQTLAARHPELVRSLVSVMSTTGARRVGRAAWRTQWLLLGRGARSRDEAVERAVRLFGHIRSRGFPFDEEALRAAAGAAWDRAHDPAGARRQLAAILASGDRTAELGSIRAPTLVIHGDRDPMVHPSGGRATAAAIPGARLESIAGLGHDLPRGVWPELARLVAAHADGAGRLAPFPS